MSLWDEFSSLEDVHKDTEKEHSKELIRLANDSLKSRTLQGIDTSNIRKMVSTNHTDSIPWEHMSMSLDMKYMYDISGRNVQTFKVFNFIEEIQTALSDKSSINISTIKAITLPENIRVIDDFAFSNSLMLETIDFDDNSNLFKIGYCAFSYCNRLKTLDLSKCEKLTKLDEGFLMCSTIETLKLPYSIEEIHKNAFSGSKLTQVFIGNEKYDIAGFIDKLERNSYRSFWGIL